MARFPYLYTHCMRDGMDTVKWLGFFLIIDRQGGEDAGSVMVYVGLRGMTGRSLGCIDIHLYRMDV